MTPEKEARRREQHRRSRELRKLAEQCLRELFTWLALRKQGLVADEDWPFDRPDPHPEGRRCISTYDAQGRLTSTTDYRALTAEPRGRWSAPLLRRCGESHVVLRGARHRPQQRGSRLLHPCSSWHPCRITFWPEYSSQGVTAVGCPAARLAHQRRHSRR
jgi:hypothetical protein